METKRVTKRVLGLDASTSTVGIAVIDYQPHFIKDIPSVELVHHDFYKPPKTGNIFSRLDQVQDKIAGLLKEFEPDDVVVEDIILFMKGRSTAKTITSLAIFNRAVGLKILQEMGRPPHLLNVMAIRHCLKLTKDLPAKEDIPDLVAHHLGINFPWKFNKKGKPFVENGDVADAIAVALTFINKSYAPKLIKKKKEKKTK